MVTVRVGTARGRRQTQAGAREFEIFAEALGEGPYVLGETFSVVDIYAAMLATWTADAPAFFAKHPNIMALHDLVVARPRIAMVWERNEV